MIAELAQLSRADYEAVRVATAKKLGFRASALDKIVEEQRALEEDEEVGNFMAAVVPWEDRVDGDELLAELCETFERHIVMTKAAALTCALWALHAHAHDAAQHSPILFISSPTKRCGKTNLLVVLSGLVPKPLSAANVTPATTFRAIARWKPTMLIDEMDTFISDKSELRGVLNSGHTRSQAYVLRCVGDDLVPTQFSVWSPKVFAKIGQLHPTLEDRSIPIGLKRKMQGEHAQKPPKDTITAFEELRRKCARWAQDHFEALIAAKPQVPQKLNDRAQDNWEPLLGIADSCGDEWGAKARKIACKLSGEEDDQTHGIMLLQDIKDLFEQERVDRLASTEIVRRSRGSRGSPMAGVLSGQGDHAPWCRSSA
jgi:putative DNA primase/helicase